MKDILFKSLVKFNSFSIFLQAGVIAFSGLFLFFTVDAWFSPFFFHGYQLITYMFIVLVLSSWLAHQAIYRLVKSCVLWDYSKSQNSAKVRSCKEISVKDICDCELSSLAKNVADAVIGYWCDSSSNNEEFIKEIQIQTEDIFSSLSEKLSKIKIEYLIKNLLLISHNHLKSYMKTVSYCNSSAGSQPKFIFAHPVSRGEISLEFYLDSLSHTVMKEFIPGSVQDCSAVFDLSCAVFCSKFLIKFVDYFSQPRLILQSILQILESIDNDVDITDANSSFLSENPSSPQSFSPTLKSAKPIEDPSSESSPKTQIVPEESELNKYSQNSPITRKGSPVLAGSLSCNCLPLSHPCQIEESTLDHHSSVKSGLCSSLSTVTAPVLSSQSINNFSSENQIPPKPHSLPLENTAAQSDVKVIEDKTASSSIDNDVSPVYEDVEDFATAIAKLRSLLEQRVSSNGNDIGSCGKNSGISPIGDARTSSSGAETESSFEELTEASELPNDSRIFFSIKIPRTETCTLPNEGQHSFYCIVYDGIYSAVSAAMPNNVEESQKDTRLVLKSRSVRRRFHQFMQLHAQLEASEDAAISQAIRSIRGPSKWLNLPFSRLDQNTVSHRQIFLERYMQQLCASPIIGTSKELRNFLDYELHLSEINVSSSSAALNRVPFFAKTVSGVLQSIKTALPLPIPGFDSDQSPSVHLVPLPLPSFVPTSFDPTDSLDPSEREGKSSHSTSSTDEVDGRSTPVPCRITFSSEESKLEQLLVNWNHNDYRVESAYEAFESHLWRSELNIQLSSQEITAPDSKVLPNREGSISVATQQLLSDAWNRFDTELPLSSCVINFIVECFSVRETWLTKAPVALALKIVIGKKMEEFFQESILRLSNPDLVADNLQLINQKLESTISNPALVSVEKDTNELIGEIVFLLSKHIPGLLVKIIGEELCADVLKTTFSCLTDVQLNRDLALTLLDFIFLQICAVQSSVDRSL